MQKKFYSTWLLMGFSTPLYAQVSLMADSVILPQLVVSANRTETPMNQLSAATTVYTREDIESRQIKSLPELLRGTTGIDLTQSGGDGKSTSVFMRGTNSDHALVLIDGIKVGSATLGISPFQFIPIEQVERIEIIRGPQSSLYGSEAIGGVIQIFTRQGGTSEQPQFSLKAGGGSYDTYQVAGNVNGNWKNAWYNLGVSSIGTEGIDARQPTQGLFGFSQPDRDGYQNTAFNARVGYSFDHDAEIEASIIRSEGETEFDSSTDSDHSEFLNQTIALSAKKLLTNQWTTSLHLGQSLDESDNFRPNNDIYSFFNTTRWNASWLNKITITDRHRFVIGTDYRLDEVDSSVQYTESSRYDLGVFAEYHAQFLDNQYINASLRWDENEQFGDYVTGSIGWRANWQYGLSTFASFGNAFKAPSFNDLYFPDYGNADLDPEESTSVEVGIGGDHDIVQWELRAYHTNVENLITPVPDANFIFSAQNVGKAQIDGIELDISANWRGWNGQLSASLLDPKIRDSNNRLPRRADKTLSFDLSRSFGPLDIGGHVFAQDSRFDNTSNTIKVAGFVTADLRASYHLNNHWQIDAKVNNVLDKQYQTVNTFNSKGRNFFVAIQYNN